MGERGETVGAKSRGHKRKKREYGRKYWAEEEEGKQLLRGEKDLEKRKDDVIERAAEKKVQRKLADVLQLV